MSSPSSARAPGAEAPPEGTGPTETAAAAVFVVTFLALHTAIVLSGISPVLQGELVDPDGYTRALRAERLLETGAWFDGGEPRSNAPYGESSHWTRPLDVILASVALPLLPFLDIRGAVFAAATVVPPLLTLLVYLGAAWAVRPLVGTTVALLVPVAALAQPMIGQYSPAGRVDHHLLILMLFVFAAGHLLRPLSTDRDAPGAALAGAFAGVGLWVSTEFLAPLALLFAALTLAWILRGGERAGSGLRFSATLAAVVAVAVAVEHGPRVFTVVEYDRLSLPHVLMGLLATAFWAAATRFGSRAAGWKARAAAAGGGGLLAAGALGLAFPPFFGGPWVNVDPAVANLWLRHVRELHPLLPGRGGSLGWALLYVGPVLVALPWLAYRTYRARGKPELPGWIVLLLGVGGFTALALLQRRWSTYAEVLAAVGVAGALVPTLAALARLRPAPARIVLRAAAAAGLLLGPQLAGGALLVARAAGGANEPSAFPDGPADAACDLPSALASLGSGAEPRTILAFMDFGPEILYRTPHHVVATPYHRNEGIMASHRMLSEAPSEETRLTLARREVDVILLCPARDRAFFDRGGAVRPQPSLYTVLTRGQPPAWLREAPLEEGSGFRAFVVER